MNIFKTIINKLITKKLNIEEGEINAVSKAKLTAVVYIGIIGIQEISKAWGHPIQIPDFVLRILEGVGLWTVRDAIKS